MSAMVEPGPANRVFLVVVDDAPELKPALHYACLRARRTAGRVALLAVIEPGDSQQWMAIEDLIREEKRAEAEALLQRTAEEVQSWSAQMAVFYVREGLVREELLKLIEEDLSISILVLGAATGPDGPGPLVTHLVNKVAGRLRVPVTIVPGSLDDAQLAALT
jgi:nucleotide-binding universal stress UspA family protein